jgi:YD repeat-containing protein
MSLNGIHTQATNFTNFIKTGVDARTGQFTVAFQLPLIPANDLAGPAVSPTLSFSVLGSLRNRGFGLGWSLDLSEINLHQDAPSLRLSSGENFAIDTENSSVEPGSELLLFDAKLKSMVIIRQSDTEFRVTHKTGQIEILTQQPQSSRYLVSEIRSVEGRRVFLEWSTLGHDDFILDKIRDEQRTLLQVISDDTDVRFEVPGDETRTVRLQMTNDMLNAVYLPGIEEAFSVIYDAYPLDEQNSLLLPGKLTSPLGATDDVTWTAGEHGLQLPAGAPFPVLPRVVEWKHSSGLAQTVLTRAYEWASMHNFLGYGSEEAFDWQKGRDNLYQVEQDYEYELVETQSGPDGQLLATITRTWNRFHLLIRESTRRGNCEIKNETTYGIKPDTHWDDQPAWCQLPHKQSVTCIDHTHDTQRSDETEYRYDDSGNVLFTRTPDGIEEYFDYYPADGDEGCPASPLGMVRFLKKKTTRPKRLSDGTYGGASEISNAYTYTSLASRTEGDPALILVDKEITRDETHDRVMEVTTQTYIQEQGPHYGRIDRKVTSLNGKPTTTRYRYELTENELSTHTTITGFEGTDRVTSTQSSARSLSTGQLARERNQAGVVSRYEYDSLGRMILAVNADDSPYQTSRTSSYHVNDEVARQHAAGGNPVMIEHRLATGQHQRQWLDGEGRTVLTELEDIDHAPGVFREIARTVFDAEGRTISETQVDWLRTPGNPAEVKKLELTTSTEYDDWGQAAISTSPNGVQSVSEHDPVKLTLKVWQQNGSLKTPEKLTFHNAAGSPIKVQLFDTDGALIRTKEWVRDGLDRITRTTVSLPGQPEQITQARLDVYGRVVEQKLADGTMVNWTFAAHSDDNHPETVTVTASA